MSIPEIGMQWFNYSKKVKLTLMEQDDGKHVILMEAQQCTY